MSPAHPTEPRDRAEMCKKINPVQLLAKRNQLRQKRPSMCVIYSVPSPHPHCSHHCCFPLATVLRGYPHCSGAATLVPVDMASRSPPAQVLGTARPGQRHLFIQQGAERCAKQRRISTSSKMTDTVPLTAKFHSASQD